MSPEIIGGGVLGEKIVEDRRQFDVFLLNSHVKTVEYVSDEVTSLCPITGAPDYYTVKIYIHNTRYGLESKSVKLYLQSYRNEGNFCEEFAALIAKDVLKALDVEDDGLPPIYPEVDVTVIQKARGGVSITATANAHKEQSY